MASSSTPQIDVDETPKKRRRIEDSDSQQLDSDSVNSSSSPESGDSVERNLPTELSKWQEEHIQGLGVHVDIPCGEKLPTPQELLDMFPVDTEIQKSQSSYKFFIDKIDEIENYFMGSNIFHRMLDQEFSTIKTERARSLRKDVLFSAEEFFENRPTLEADTDLYYKKWFRRFEVRGLDFADTLYYMTLKRDKGFKRCADGKERERLKEYDFQFLFDAFVSMFGLQSHRWSEPLIPQMELSLCNADISGKADILYCQDISINDKEPIEECLNVVAVCEVTNLMDHFNNGIERYADMPVKKSYSGRKQECRRTTRGSELLSSTSSRNRLPSHIPDALLGQHGGELLMYYPYSVKRNAIFGLIVQETKVTFTALKMTEDQYRGILTGKHRFPRPRLMVTKPYDFMKMEDRTYLIKPLLQLAMFQEMTIVNQKL